MADKRQPELQQQLQRTIKPEMQPEARQESQPPAVASASAAESPSRVDELRSTQGLLMLNVRTYSSDRESWTTGQINIGSEECRMAGWKIFISGCNNLLGYTLVDELRNDHVEDEDNGKAYTFIGTVDPLDVNNPPPSVVKHVVRWRKTAAFFRSLLECDVIIYNVHSAGADEIRSVATSNVPSHA